MARRSAMNALGNGLHVAGHYEEALSVKEALLSMERRLGAPEGAILASQGNLAITYEEVGRLEEALRLKQGVFSGRLKLHGEEHERTLRAANNYAVSFVSLERFEEAKALLRKTIPVARRALGDPHDLTLSMRSLYAQMLYKDDGATLANLREAVTMLEDAERIRRRVLGGAHPFTTDIEKSLQNARAALAARETTP